MPVITYKDLLATLLITIVFDLKSNGAKGLVEIIMASVLRVLICVEKRRLLAQSLFCQSLDGSCRRDRMYLPSCIVTKHRRNGTTYMIVQRVIDVERGTFTPLVFATNGMCASECSRALKNIVQLIVEKQSELFSYAIAMSHLRCRIFYSAG